MMNPVEAKYAVNEIVEAGYKPTRWEKKFLRSIRQLIRAGLYLKDGQEEALKKIQYKAQRLPALVSGFEIGIA